MNVNIKIINKNDINIILLIITYNSRKFIKDLLYSILSQDYDLSKVLLVIIDNNSVDKTYEEILHHINRFSQSVNYIIVRLDKNLGFAPANIIGLIIVEKMLKDLNNKIMILLNPDTIILKRDFFAKVEKIVKFLPIVGFATLSGLNGIIDSLGGFIDCLGNAQDLFIGIRLTRDIKDFLNKFLPKVYPVPYVTFAAVAMRGELIKNIGFLREEYVIYFEDSEFCLRAWSNGIPTHIYREFMVWHARGGTQRANNFSINKPNIHILYHFSKNQLLLIYEYLGIFRYIFRLVINIFMALFLGQRYRLFSIFSSLYIIFKKKIKNKKIPDDLIPNDLRICVLFWALKYFFKYYDKGFNEAIAYGIKRASFEYIKYKLTNRN